MPEVRRRVHAQKRGGQAAQVLPDVYAAKRCGQEASRLHWEDVAFERRRRHAEVLRGYYDDWQARIAAGEQVAKKAH